MTTAKKIGISFFVLFMIVCTAIIGWYFYIRMHGADKIVSHTFEVGLQTTTDGTSKYFIEVNSYEDCFEVKFNYMLDETKTQLYSQGVQFYGSSPTFALSTSNFQLENKRKVGGWGLWKDYEYDQYKQYVLTSGEYYNYMMNSNEALISTNPIDEFSFFKIDLDGEIYGMKLKGEKTPLEEENYLGYKEWKDGAFNRTDHLVNYYLYYDMTLLLKELYDSISSLPNGTSEAFIFEFCDLFNYYEYNEENGQYGDVVNLDKADSISAAVKSYYSIKVTKNEGKIQNASQSLFNCVAGSSNYNVTGIESSDYFYGRTNISIDNDEFDLVEVADGFVALKLDEVFLESHLPYAGTIELSILINLDVIVNAGYEFVGFTADSGLDNFNIVRFHTVQTIDGELVYSEVAYV